MSQCVPSWDLEDPPNHPANFSTALQHSSAVVPLLPLTDSYEVAELTWENGQLALHGHGTKPPAQKFANSSWNKPRHPTGTLESVVHQATGDELFPARFIAPPHDIVNWLGVGHIAENDYSLGVAAAVDTLVPCRDAEVPAASGSVASAAKKRAAKVGVCSSQGSVAAPQKPLAVSRRLSDESILASIDSRGVTDEVEITNTSATATTTASDSDVPEDGSHGSPETEDTMYKAKRIVENDSVMVNRRSLHTKRDAVCEEEKGKGIKRESQKPSSSNKKSRAAIVHNQSERKRRDRINQKMKTLQKLVPNSSKTDKASILDGVIEYLKQLQAQVQAMNRMNSMMLPMPMPPIQMAMMANMAQMAQMAQMGMGMGMVDMNAINRPVQTAIPPPLLHPSAFMPLTAAAWDGVQQASSTVRPDPFSAFLAYQNAQQPMNLDGYNRMAALFQQMYPQRPPTNPNS